MFMNWHFLAIVCYPSAAPKNIIKNKGFRNTVGVCQSSKMSYVCYKKRDKTVCNYCFKRYCKVASSNMSCIEAHAGFSDCL